MTTSGGVTLVNAPVIAATSSSMVAVERVEVRRPPPEAQDLHTVGDLQRVGQGVGDQNDAKALIADPCG